MGNCDFKTEPPAKNVPTTTSKANFQFHYVIGRGGYGKVLTIRLSNRFGKYKIKKTRKIMR